MNSAMASEFKAIYRLEFYKNKKKWKLSHEVKRNPLSSQLKLISGALTRAELETGTISSNYKSLHEEPVPVNQNQQLTTQCEPIEQQFENFSPAEFFQTGDEWFQSNGYPTQQEEYAPYNDQYGLPDNTIDFVRGAHLAPHSTEYDLSTSDDECRCMTSQPLYVLTCRQLSEAIQRHAAALRQLLIELAIRENLFSQKLLTRSLAPVRNATCGSDPVGVDCMPALWGQGGQECVLASGGLECVFATEGQECVLTEGRGNMLAARGMGRGSPPRDKPLIGIVMGRPYRL